MTTENRTPLRGFAAMSPEKRRAIASKGGKAAHAKGTAHQWTSEDAYEAGKVGGHLSQVARAERKAAAAKETAR